MFCRRAVRRGTAMAPTGPVRSAAGPSKIGGVSENFEPEKALELFPVLLTPPYHGIVSGRLTRPRHRRRPCVRTVLACHERPHGGEARRDPMPRPRHRARTRSLFLFFLPHHAMALSPCHYSVLFVGVVVSGQSLAA